jgi:Tfp pilus assembly protein PilP
MRALLLGLLFATACGGDDAPPPATKGAAPGGGAAAAQKKKDDKNKLQPRMHVEDLVSCPVPDKPTGPECKPDAPTCDEGRYCVPGEAGFHCEPCPERDAIRHEFKERDFVSDQARDPFQSYVVVQGELGKPEATAKPQGSCKRIDQFVASSFGFQELKLVGIVTQGTQRKVLMMAPDNKGYIIKRADCVGKEKAIVKDIGVGYITFVTEADPERKRPPSETSVQLHSNTLDINAPLPDLSAPPTPIDVPPTSAPVVAPPK